MDQAKADILASAEKVTRLRNVRYQQSGLSVDAEGLRPEEGERNIKVSVPFNMVGLVIGIKGGRIKEIAAVTNTYIKTPSKHREPVFEIVGDSESVEVARNMIYEVVKAKLEEDYIKRMMTQMPIHEPGSPVELMPMISLPSVPIDVMCTQSPRSPSNPSCLYNEATPRTMSAVSAQASYSPRPLSRTFSPNQDASSPVAGFTSLKPSIRS